MHNIRVKLTVDIFILITVVLTYGVALNDLLSIKDNNLHQIRGCFLFVATLMGEELAYYVTKGMLYKKTFILHTIMFAIQILIMAIIFLIMLSGIKLNYISCLLIAFLLVIYPMKCTLECFSDVYKLYHQIFYRG